MDIRVCLLCFLVVLFRSEAIAQYQRPVQNMSVRDIEDERSGIQLHQKYVHFMSKTAEGIRDGACRSFWRGAKRAKRELEEIPAGVRNFSYRHKRAQKEQENKAYLDKYEQCFSKELANYPNIYHNELDPARSYSEFVKVYDKLEGKLNSLQARFYELGQELRRRGVG